MSASHTGPGSVAQEDQPAARRLVFFDLDETITRHDTLFPYALGYMLRKRPWRALMLVTVLPALLAYLRGLTDEGKVKEAFLKATLRGVRRADLEAHNKRFVPHLMANGLIADALKQLAEHRRCGDYLVLMSASTDLYVPDVGRELGFDEVICTGVRWNGDTFDGTLTTRNRKGDEKAVCFNAVLERHNGSSTVAYGNSSTDLPHLKLATRGVLVNGSQKARETAAALGVACVDWR